MYPLPPRGSVGRDPRISFVYFNTKSCILVHFFGFENGLYHCLSRPLCIGKMKAVGRGCRMRPEGPKIEAEGRERGGVLGRGSKPHQLGGLAVM